MKKVLLGLSLSVLVASLVLPAYSAAPAKLGEVAPVEDLVSEARAQVQSLEDSLKDDASYSAGKERAIPRAAGVVACMAQAIVEHPNKGEVQVAAAHLRDAAIRLQKTESYEQATERLGEVKQALDGSKSGEAADEHEWNKLINLHRLMEEVNVRNSKVRRVLRRSRDPQEESLHATTLAVLALVIHEDTHEVKDEANVPDWQSYAKDFHQNMSQLSAAIKAKNSDDARKYFLDANKACNACHKKFRVPE